MEATKWIKAVQPKIKIIALTALEDPLQITRALEEGMDGFLLKRASPRELKLAIETAVAGEQYLSPQVSAIIAKAYLDERNRKHAPAPLLTPREKQVVTRIADDMRVKQIAEEMEISEQTVTPSLDVCCFADTISYPGIKAFAGMLRGNVSFPV
ncbi:MAG TPA: response regulator transcription factor [Desulfuromonadales bacterium]|nr:response regulator transcription factor [Desulfuromonadales bacterium]